METTFDWNTGKLITLKQGDNATVTELDESQLYGFFFYNSAQHETSIRMTFNWSNRVQPEHIVVPGTTDNEGLASMAFVWGGDSQTVTASVDPDQPLAEITCFIGSAAMPTDTTGINNQEIPEDGQPHPTTKFTRYWFAPASTEYDAIIKSGKSQIIVVRFTEEDVKVLIVNPTQNPEVNSYILGAAKRKVTIIQATEPPDVLHDKFSGTGEGIVWMNADSVQNSDNATITICRL